MNKLIKLFLALLLVIMVGCLNLSGNKSTIIVKVGTNEDGVEMCAQKMGDGSYSSSFKCPR